MKRTPLQNVPMPVEIPASPEIRILLGQDTRLFKMGGCNIILNQKPDMGWYMSISCKNRYPTWDEIAQARYRLIPSNVYCVMPLPPESEYINAHEYTFHIVEINPVRVDAQGKIHKPIFPEAAK